MSQINTAFAGFGSGGRIYNAPIVTSVAGFSIKKILTSSAGNVAAARTDFPEAEVVSEYSQILEDPEIDLILVLLPNHLHYEFTKKALEAGKHVLVEKPFAPTVKEADELISLAREKNLILSVHHNRRWDSDFQTVRKVIESGKLGQIVLYESHFDRFREEIKTGWKEQPEIPGSGVLYDLGSHLIDQALTLFGNPSEVFADIRIQRKAASVPDYFEVLLLYPNLKVSLNAGMLIMERGPKFSIFGTEGSFLKHGMDVQEEALKKGEKPNDSENWGKEPSGIWGNLKTTSEEKRIRSESGDYRRLYENLRNAILGKDELIVKPEQARDVIKIIEAAYRSSNEKRIVPFD